MGFSVFTVLNNGYLIFFLKVDPFLSFLEFSQRPSSVRKRERERERGENAVPLLTQWKENWDMKKTNWIWKFCDVLWFYCENIGLVVGKWRRRWRCNTVPFEVSGCSFWAGLNGWWAEICLLCGLWSPKLLFKMILIFFLLIPVSD
jgi:hypothetical protein